MTAVQSVDFTSFVFAQGDDIKTTSLLIAEKFSKSHTHVLRDIEKIMTQVSDIFGKTNFGLTEYEQQNNLGLMTKYKMYELTKDGFIMVVMSYTGAKAFAIKEAYINAFNLMHAKLFPKHDQHAQPQIQTLTPAMKKHINRQVSFLVKTQVGTTHSVLSKSIQDKFNVNKRELIPASKYREVCAFLGCEPDPKALQGELLEPVQLEYQPPKGMVLIAESELEELRHKREFDYVEFIRMMDKSNAAGYVMAEKAKIRAALYHMNEVLQHYI